MSTIVCNEGRINVHSLMPTHNKLTAYTGQRIDILGICNLSCTKIYKGKKHDLDFHAVINNFSCFLGLAACKTFDLIKKKKLIMHFFS